MRTREARGFTFVELVVAVGIVGILIAIAAPIYNNYTVRTRVAEGLLALSQCREIVSEIYQFSSPGFTVSANGWGCGENTTRTQYVTTVSTDVDGVVTVVFRNLGSGLAGKSIQMIPHSDGLPLQISDLPSHVNEFVCVPGGPDPLDDTYVPGNCR